jgi:hypothetical protein
VTHPPQPPHPRRRLPLPHPQPITTLPLPPNSRPRLHPHRLPVLVPVPVQALPLRRHLAQSLVHLPLRLNNLPPCLARLKLLLVPATIIPLPAVSPSQAGPLSLDRNSPSTTCTRPSSVLALLLQLSTPSWSLNVRTLTYIPNTTIPLPLYRFILLFTCL